MEEIRRDLHGLRSTRVDYFKMRPRTAIPDSNLKYDDIKLKCVMYYRIATLILVDKSRYLVHNNNAFDFGKRLLAL